MLFNSLPFIAVFLPVTIILMLLAQQTRWIKAPSIVMTLCSFVFYGYWNGQFLCLFVATILFNFYCGKKILYSHSKPWLIFGLALNFGLLGYYKYRHFFLENVGYLTGNRVTYEVLIMPLGISFFTFLQMAYLVDAYRRKIDDDDLLDYALFVSFFPHLVAGPLTHHKQLIPQFVERRLKIQWQTLVVGVSYFTFGLSKKLLLGDYFGRIADPIIDDIAFKHGVIYWAEAWYAMLNYGMQIYFDFSGYTDMAVGLAIMFGITLPENFNSPYKAKSMIDFWRRWHMTLSSFIRDYVYIPLGGSRCSSRRHKINLFIAMTLCGFWHGANWTFIVWGMFHGALLILNHLIKGPTRPEPAASSRFIYSLVTFGLITMGWTFFRAPNISVAWYLFSKMIPLPWTETMLPLAMAPTASWWLKVLGLIPSPLSMFWPYIYSSIYDHAIRAMDMVVRHCGVVFEGFDSLLAFDYGANRRLPTDYSAVMFFLGLVIVFVLPNTRQIMSHFVPNNPGESQDTRLRWTPTCAWAIILSILFGVCLNVLLAGSSKEFLYFQF